MTLKQYIDSINEFVKQNPEALELDVVHSSDEEGNRFHLIHFPISKGRFDGWDYDMNNENPNAVCIN